ncbi:MFS transporter [Paludisphaera mucosa]|uniref:MFS transporter n=1 Tax=Paludisphaera mucosa TaxID=3030827 RepID=A0ABT6FBM5_9BACT|nr:MFS transporter [Paludisphaera mucosa]MDG3004981.1 MFS transporter [Paludisphaera mucosa]
MTEPSESPTRVRFGVLAFLAAMTFVLYLDRVCIGQAAPRIQEELGISDTRMGWVFSAFSLSYVLFEIPTGRWGDRYGSRGVLTRIVVWWSIFTALTGAAGGLVGLLAIRFLFGAGEAGALPNSARVLRVWFSDASRGRAQGLITTAMMLGGTLAPVVSQRLIDGLGWRATFWAFGLVGLAWAAAFYVWFRDDPDSHPGVNGAERRLIADGRGGEDVSRTHSPIPWPLVFRSADIWLLGGAMITMAAIYNLLIAWYPKYLQAARGASAGDSANLASLVLGAGAVGCLFGGWLTDRLTNGRVGRRWGRTLQCVLGAALAAGALAASLSVDSPGLSAAFVALACFGVQIQVPAWWAAATQVSGRHVGALFGLMNMIGNVGGIVSPSFLGWFVDAMKAAGRTGRDQWDPGFWIYVGVALVGMVLWALVDPRRVVGEAVA